MERERGMKREKRSCKTQGLLVSSLPSNTKSKKPTLTFKYIVERPGKREVRWARFNTQI